MNVLKRRDSEDTLGSAATQHEQAFLPVEVALPEHDNRAITRVVAAGMGGSGLASLLAKTWLDAELTVPFEGIRGYRLPRFVDSSTLVVISSCSGNTEEMLAVLEEARQRNAQVAIVTGGGALLERAKAYGVTHVVLPPFAVQPRMLTIAQLRALTALLVHFGVVGSGRFDEIAEAAEWLKGEVAAWTPDVTTGKNYAKQLALHAVGKTPVFYGGELTSSAAYKWKISWNENAKNVAFWNEYPEVNHNEFMGWTSHPVEKPFAIVDLVSSYENDRILKRFAVSDRLLSGRRPKAITVELHGDTLLKQLLWANILADFASIYVGIMNNVDPGPVPLITKLKQELDR